MPEDNVSAPVSTDATGAPSLPTVATNPAASAAPPVDNATTGGADATAPAVPVVDNATADNPVASNPVASDPVTSDSAMNAAAAGGSSVIVDSMPVDAAAKETAPMSEVPAEVAHKIDEAHNVLVALSSDPSVDEMAAAIGLTLFLDKLGKRATAIYSGATPNALEFLKPEETFEPSVDTLQDFVIALNKEKADHLRYKLDGDFVKIFITPYKSKISEEDLEFSYGDYNVDLVLALDVANGVDLDAALREHGRIMHDAVIINITTSNPGKLGEIEWSDKAASSVSEMIARLLYGVKSEAKIEKEEATAFLTGIVAATNRFSNSKTTPDTMRMASRLMESGANQQLVSKNITPDVENEMLGMIGMQKPKTNDDPTKLDIEHDGEKVKEEKTVEAKVTEKPSTLLDDLKAAEASLAAAGAETTPEKGQEPLKIDSANVETNPEKEQEILGEELAKAGDEGTKDAVVEDAAIALEKASESVEAAGVETTPEITLEKEPEIKDNGGAEAAPEKESEAGNADDVEALKTEEKHEDLASDQPEKVVQPLNDMGASTIPMGEEGKYGQMLEDALKSIDEPKETAEAITSAGAASDNPAATGAPTVAANPEINGVPEINYMPMPGDAVLPPPPTPPIDMSSPMPMSEPAQPAETNGLGGTLPEVQPIAPAEPKVEPEPASLGAQPAMQDQVYGSQAADPGAFKIPGV